MARPVAADFDDKRIAIRKAAALIFASKGYDRASMQDVAAGCGVSKALLYHYYPKKDAILFDIIHTHLTELAGVVEAANDVSLDIEQRLHKVISAIVECYKDADAEHKIQINHLEALPVQDIAKVKSLEKRLVDIMADIVRGLNPDADPRHIKPGAMAIFGTLNWKYMWFREGGEVSREEFAVLTAQIFAAGIAALPKVQRAKTAVRKQRITSGRNRVRVRA